MPDMPSIEGYYLGFDFGMKRIGVAIGQTISKTAAPLQTLSADQGEPSWSEIKMLIQKWHPKALIVGLPFTMNDAELSVTQDVLHFARKLEEQFKLPVYLSDERLTSKEARSRLFEKGGYRALQNGKIDQIAAVLILEQWFSENA